MDYSALWTTVRKALRTSDHFSIGSADVADLLGADRISRTEVEQSHGKNLTLETRYEFRSVRDEYRWDLHFWKV